SVERGRRIDSARVHLCRCFRDDPRGGSWFDARRRLGGEPRLFASVIAKGKLSEDREVGISKITAVVIGIVAIVLGYIFETQNVAFMVGLAFSVAASCNFPVLLMAIMWKGTTTLGAFVGGLLGLVTSVAGVVLGPPVWVKTFGFASAPFPYDNPALFSMAIAFGSICLFSKLDASKRAQADRAGFEPHYLRSEPAIPPLPPL